MDTSMLNQIRSYSFAAHDMLLYLDTHPTDKEAFEMFKDLVCKAKALKAEYEEKNGPLTAFGTACQSGFNWLESPWPWEKEAN